jgi:small subunit ribosomal protein S16
MLMMRLQRVGRKNDPAYRIVVTDKRTGVKSDKHVDRIGSYNPKLSTIILDKEKAKEWLAKGVQPSDTMHNILVSQGVIDAKKINVLPRKSPIVDPEAVKKAEEAAAAKVEAEKAAAEAEAVVEETPAEEAETTEETPAQEVAEEPVAEEKTEEVVEEAPVEEPVTATEEVEEKKA